MGNGKEPEWGARAFRCAVTGERPWKSEKEKQVRVGKKHPSEGYQKVGIRGYCKNRFNKDLEEKVEVKKQEEKSITSTESCEGY